ncbi:MAG: hypothetical protein JWM64_2247 [Frankiales bacterium]|nr:hypothetical protein [Frankiales bacterium]
MSPAEQVVDALLAGDVEALRRLRSDPDVGPVARAGLLRLAPSDVDHDLPDDAVVLLRAVSGRPGLSRAELQELVGNAVGAADLLLERGLVTSRRFDRTDCWTRTSAGAALLRAL